MMNNRFFLNLKTLFSLFVLLAAMSLKQSLVLAQFIPPPPPNLGQPSGNRQGGASRGDCPAVVPDLTALIPATTISQTPLVESVWGLTTLEHPDFWFYTPYALTADLPGEFVLLDDQQQYVYRTLLTNVAQPGIIKVTLPQTLTGLEAGKVYHWSFLIYCGSDSPLFTQGSIQRITPSTALTHQLSNASPQVKARLYANNGIWYESLSTIAELRLAHPNDSTFLEDWRNLLESVDLQDMVMQPIDPEDH